jgi:hypothetical protein
MKHLLIRTIAGTSLMLFGLGVSMQAQPPVTMMRITGIEMTIIAAIDGARACSTACGTI